MQPQSVHTDEPPIYAVCQPCPSRCMCIWRYAFMPISKYMLPTPRSAHPHSPSHCRLPQALQGAGPASFDLQSLSCVQTQFVQFRPQLPRQNRLFDTCQVDSADCTTEQHHPALGPSSELFVKDSDRLLDPGRQIWALARL